MLGASKSRRAALAGLVTATVLTLGGGPAMAERAFAISDEGRSIALNVLSQFLVLNPGAYLAVGTGVKIYKLIRGESYSPPCDSLRGKSRFAKLMDGACEDEEDRPPPPPPPPPPPQITLDQVARIEAASAYIQRSVRGDAALRLFSDELDREMAKHSDIGLGFKPLPPDFAGVPAVLATAEHLRTLAAEAASWVQPSKVYVEVDYPESFAVPPMRVPIMTHEVQVTSGNISGALSLNLPVGAKPENGPEYGAWAVQVAEGVADVVAKWQQRKVSWFTTVYVKKELGPIYTVIHNQAAALLTGSGAVQPQVLAAMEVVRKAIFDYRAGKFGGPQGPVPPKAADDRYEVDPFAPSHLRAIDLQANDRDLNGDFFAVVEVGDAANGSVALAGAPSGRFPEDPTEAATMLAGIEAVFTPGESFAAGGGSFRYTVRDARGQTASATVTLAPSRVPPAAKPDRIEVRSHLPTPILSGALLGNDVSPQGRKLSIHRVGDAVGGSVFQTVGGVSWIPDAGTENGDEGGFTYYLWDGMAGEVAGRVTVVHTKAAAVALDRPPQAAADRIAYPPTGSPMVLVPLSRLLANDRDPDGDPLEISRIDAPQNLVAEPDFTAGHVAVRLEEGANEGRFGYLVRDGLGGGATARVTVARTNQLPEALRDYRSIEPDRPARIPGAGLVANDVDVDGHTLRVTTVSDPLNGTVTLDGDTAVFTPESPFGIEGGAFLYTVADPLGGEDTALVRLSPIDLPPVANDDEIEIAPNAPSDIPLELLTINDTHPNGRAFSFEEVGNPVNGSVYVPPGGGAVARFEPDAAFAASGGSFTYAIADSRGGRSTATVRLLPGQSAPVAQDDRVEVSAGGPSIFSAAELLANDIDPNGGRLGVVAIAEASGGTVVAAADGATSITMRGSAPRKTTPGGGRDRTNMIRLTVPFELTEDGVPDAPTYVDAIRFEPAEDFFDHGGRFTYVVRNTAGEIAKATVSLVPRNLAPRAEPDLIVHEPARRIEIETAAMLANDVDRTGDPLRMTQVFGARGGTVALSDDAAHIVFEPDTAALQHGFSYIVEDPFGGQGHGRVTFQIAFGLPVAVNDRVVLTDGPEHRIPIADLLANDRDPSGGTPRFSHVVDAQFGRAYPSDDGEAIIFEPGAAFATSGVATIGYAVRARSGVGQAVARVTVVPPPPPRHLPIAADDVLTVDFGDANTARIPVASLLANDRVVAVDGAGVSDAVPVVVDVFDTENLVGFLDAPAGTVVLSPQGGFDASGQGSFRYRIRHGASFDEAVVTLSPRTPSADATLSEPRFVVSEDTYRVELVQSILVGGANNPFDPRDPLGGTSQSPITGASQYVGRYGISCTSVSDGAAFEADFGIAGTYQLEASLAGSQLRLAAPDPFVPVQDSAPDLPDFSLRQQTTNSFGDPVIVVADGAFSGLGQISFDYSLAYAATPAVTSDFRCSGGR